MKRFIQYLDSYASCETLTENDYVNLIQNINANYILNRPLTYIEWQDKYEVDVFPFEPVLVAPKPLIKKTIDTKIHSIADLIQLIHENEYDPVYEYNIDLKSLHMIKDELVKIDRMIGLADFKRSVLDQLIYFIQKLHLGTGSSDFKHTVLSGPPGTGKTEVAQLLGSMYSKLGILSKNVFQKVTRSDLIAGYLGQTALKTKKVIEQSLGGVLFIDEAYSLATDNDTFSKECIDTLCEALSAHKDDLMVIIAGYDEELNHDFFKANRGLPSRFIWRFKTEPYTAAELKQIFIKMVLENEWDIDLPVIKKKEVDWFEKNKGSFVSYGRDMEVLFTYTKIAHGRRIYGDTAAVPRLILLDDLEKGFRVFLSNKSVKEENRVFKDMFV